MATTTKYTYADLLALPEDGHRYEIIDGEVYMSPPPSRPHQWASTALVRLLGTHVVRRKLGDLYHAPFALIVSEHNVFEPDVLFIAAERTEIAHDDGVHGPPDLCIEIGSPSTERRDRTTKFEQYAQFGVQEYWLGNTILRTIEVFTLADGAYRSLGVFSRGDFVASRVLPDLRLRARMIFIPGQSR